VQLTDGELGQRRQFSLDDAPDEVWVDVHVGVDDSVSEAGDSGPGDLRMSLLQLRRKSLCGFGDRMKTAKTSVIGVFTGKEALPPARDGALNRFGRAEDVLQVVSITLTAQPQSPTASRRTRRVNSEVWWAVTTWTRRPSSSVSRRSRRSRRSKASNPRTSGSRSTTRS
jgi:hypothetical protein